MYKECLFTITWETSRSLHTVEFIFSSCYYKVFTLFIWNACFTLSYNNNRYANVSLETSFICRKWVLPKTLTGGEMSQHRTGNKTSTVFYSYSLLISNISTIQIKHQVSRDCCCGDILPPICLEYNFSRGAVFTDYTFNE